MHSELTENICFQQIHYVPKFKNLFRDFMHAEPEKTASTGWLCGDWRVQLTKISGATMKGDNVRTYVKHLKSQCALS